MCCTLVGMTDLPPLPPPPFERAVAYVLQNEGSQFTDAFNDRGAATRFGVTQATLATWRDKPTTAEDVKSLTLAEAKAIYLAEYWKRMNLWKFHSQAVAVALMDTGVLCGPTSAATLLQEAVGVDVDGVIGPNTIRAANGFADAKLLPVFAYKVMDHHMRLAERVPSQRKWLYGWLCRAARLLLLVGG